MSNFVCILVQGNPSNYSYTQLRDRQWVAADVPVCVHWSTTTPRRACFSCTMHCELSCFKHTILSLFNFTKIANKGMCLYRLTQCNTAFDIVVILFFHYYYIDPCLDIRSRVSAGIWNYTGQDVESVPDLPQPNTK